MQLIIPAAGAGTRLRTITDRLPKILIPVAGRPVIDHLLGGMEGLSPQRVILVVGEHHQRIQEYLDRLPAQAGRRRLPLELVLQREPRGLAEAVLLGLKALSRSVPGPVLILLGDTLLELDWTALLSQGEDCLGVSEVDDPRAFGVAVVEDGFVRQVVEKPNRPLSRWALVGLYLFHDPEPLQRAIETLFREKRTTRGEFQLTDALDLLLEQGHRFKAFPIQGWLDCGTPEALLQTNRELLGRLRPQTSGGRAHPAGDSLIIPPVALAPDVRLVRSIVGPFVTLDERVTLSSAIVADAILCADALVEDAVVRGAVLGERAVLRGEP